MVILRAVSYCVLSASLLLCCSAVLADKMQLRGGSIQSFPGIAVLDGSIVPENDYGHAQIIDCIETALNARIDWQTLPTDRLLKLTRENQLDLIYPMGYTDERHSYLPATVWLTQDDDYFVFKAHSAKIGVVKTLTLPPEQLKSSTIGVKRGSPQQHYLQSNGYNHVHEVYEYQQLLPLLLMDRVEILAVPQTLAEQLQAQLKADNTPHNLQLYNYYTRDAGFYLAPDFAQTKLQKMNDAVLQCRQFVKTVTAIK